MAEFKREQLDVFLGVVRKYMQVRGNLTQKQLAERTGIGDSTMSRFMNQKTSELSADMISRIVAFLNIPPHEIIDFVEEEFTEEFRRYVNFHREGKLPIRPSTVENQVAAIKPSIIASGDEKEDFLKKIESLNSKQKLYLKDFFNLGTEEKDLVVDVGNNIMRFVRQKNYGP